MSTLDSSENDLPRRDSCLSGRSTVPILALPPPGQRFRPFPRSTNHPSPVIVMFFVLSRHSTSSQQRRRNSEPLEAIEDRHEQLALVPFDLGHNTTLAVPTPSPVHEIVTAPHRLIRRATHGAGTPALLRARLLLERFRKQDTN